MIYCWWNLKRLGIRLSRRTNWSLAQNTLYMWRRLLREEKVRQVTLLWWAHWQKVIVNTIVLDLIGLKSLGY